MNKISFRKATNKLLRNSLLVFLAVHTTLILPVLGSRMPFLKDSGLVEKAEAASQWVNDIFPEKDSFFAHSYVTTLTDRHAISIGNTWWGSWFQETYGLIKFPQVNLPPNAIIVSARIDFVSRNNDNGAFNLEVRKALSDWPENNTNSHVAVSPDVVGNIWLDGAGLIMSWRTIYLSSSAFDYLRTPNFGFALYRTGGNSQYGGLICSSDNFGMDGAYGCEAQHMPRLSVEYILNQPPYTPAPALPANNFDFSGNCDESVTPATGACRTGNNLTLTLNGVGDGDQSPGNHREVHFAGTNTSTAQNFDYRKDVTLNDGNPTSQSYTGNFADGKYVWYGYSLDHYNLRGQDSVPFNFTTDTTPPTVPVLNALPEFTAGVGIDQTVQFEITPTGFSTDNIATNEEVGYMLEYSTDPTFATNTFAKPVQRFTATSPRIEIGPKGADGIEGNADDITQETAYYFRMKVKDKLGNISAWSNTVTSKIDSTKPVASDITINPLRFSPQNATSVGSFDLLEFGYKFSEANTKLVGFEVLDKDFNIVYRFTEAPATVSNTDTTLNYTWNGLDSNGAAVIDGAYIIRPYLEDLAGNILTIKETEHQRLFTLDNTGVDVIFNQVQDLWINSNSTTLTGQVIDVGDLQTFEFSLNGLGDLINVSLVQGFTYDENSDQWSYTANLVDGLNKFFFRTTDTVENKQDFERNINLDTSKPSLMNFGITNPKDSQFIDLSNTDSNLFNANTGNVKFEMQDSGAGLKTGTNPDSYKVTAFIKSWNRETQSFYETTKEIFKSGVNLDASFNTDLLCSPSAGFTAKIINGIETSDRITCSFDLKSLGDTDYRFQVEYKDAVGNMAENIFSSDTLEVDSYVYLEVRAPRNGANYPTKKIDIVGFASKGSEMNIKNIQTGLDEIFIIEENLEPQVIGDFEITKIVCGTFINHDNNPLTEDEEVCRYDLKSTLHYDPLLEITPNDLQISVTDNANNSSTQNISVNVSINNFAVAISPSSVYLSPNGDGYQEDVTFFHFVYNPEDPFNKPLVKSYSLKIKNTNGDIVKEFIGLAGLDSYNYWDLKDEAGNTVPDGEYKYQISVISVDDIEKLSQEKSIFINTTVEDRTYISTPITGTETTNGVVTIQGQAPATNAPESQTPLRGQIFANICVDALVPAGVNVPDYIVAADRYPASPQPSPTGEGVAAQSPLINFGQGDNVGCDHWQEVLVDENGFFSTVIIFPSIEGLPSVTHNITAYSTDLFGNSTPNSNQVSITIDGADPFIEVYLEPTLTGVSTLEDYNKFLNGEISIEDIRSLRIRSVVRGGTEQVELSFADYSNVAQRPDSPTYNFIALLTNRIEQDLKKNPRQVENIKYNHNKILGDATVPYENCNPASPQPSPIEEGEPQAVGEACVWDYLLPMTDEYGGIYEIKFKGKRGTTIEEMTRGFQVDGRIPAAPVFMVIEKWDEATQTWVKMENVDFDNFTDVSKIRFRGAAEPFTQVELWTADVLDENGNVIQAGVKFADVIVGNTGVWEFIIDLEDFIDAGGSIDNLPGGPGDTSGETCSGIECFRSRLGFILKGFKVDREGNPVQLDENGNPDTVISEDSVVVNYDRKAPALQTIDRITPDRTIQGWAQTGDQAIFNLKFDEAVFVGELIKEDGFVRLLDKVSEVKDDKGIVIEDNYTSVVNVDDPFEGIYNITVRAKDLAENRKSYLSQNYQQYNVNDFRIFIDNTKPDNTSIDNSSTEWSTTWEQGGLNSGKRDEATISPVYEKGRTNPEYVTKSDYVEIRGRAEKNQRIEIFMAVPNLDANGNLIPDDRPAIERGGQVIDIINVSDENCVAYSFDKVTFDGVTTKYNSLCDWSYKYYFTDNGANEWDGTPLSGYVLQARVIDKAANESDWTNTIIIYHDKTTPTKPYITKVASSSYSPIVGWNIINPEGDVITNPYPVTKDTSVTVTTDAERFGDLVIKAENPKGENIFDRTSVNDSDREVFTDISLGDQTDERTGCTTMQGLRRVGTCQDGLYKFSVNVTDAVGYTSETRVVQVERDTVRPEMPKLGIIANDLAQTISVRIQAEPGSQINFNDYNYYNLSDSGQADFLAVTSAGWFYDTTYTFKVRVTDRAGNVSNAAYVTYRTPLPPQRVLGVCTNQDGSLSKLAYPFTGDFGITSYYGNREWGDGSTEFHDGVDFATPRNTELLASAKGFVSWADVNNANNDGMGLMMAHPSIGLHTLYWHLDKVNLLANSNRTWERGTVIGLSGNTGRSTGPHLHFNVRTGGGSAGEHTNPLQYLGDCNEPPKEEDLCAKGSTNAGSLQCSFDNNQVKNKFRNFIEQNIVKEETYIGDDSNGGRVPNKKISEIDDLSGFIDNSVHKWCDAWVLDFGSIKEKNGGQGYDGIAVLNNYDGKVYLVKNAIWEKYKSMNGPCGDLGVPSSTNGSYTESWAYVRDDSRPRDDAKPKAASVQRFRNGNFTQNSIYWYQWDAGYRCSLIGWCYETKDVAYAVHSNVANYYESYGGTAGTYGFPTGDTYSLSCGGKQWFEYGKEINLCDIGTTDPAETNIKLKEKQFQNPVRNGGFQEVCGAKAQNYSSITVNGTVYQNAWIIFNSERSQSYIVSGGIGWAYWDRGGCAKFGLPTSDEGRTAGQPGWYQRFQNADIYWAENSNKSHPGIVAGEIRSHYESLGGTTSYLGFPEGEQWGDESNCGTLGSMQNFGGGRVYSSKFGEYDMSWSDDWYRHYAELGEVRGDLGWPKSAKLQNDSLMFFEAGFISSKVGALGIGWWLEETKTGCEKVGRDLDGISGAPQCIQDGLWNKEDNFFNTYRRVPGANGSLHKLTEKLWIVDYEAVALKDGNTQGWSVLIGNEANCSVNYVGGKAWDWYRDGNKWDSAGAPTSDTQFNIKPQYHDGQLTHYQIFANQIYSYSDNLKLGGGFLGLGTWRNYATDGVISVKEIKDVYSTTIPETKDAPYIHGYLGAPVDSEIKLNRVEVDGTTQFLVGQEFQGGYIVYRENLGRYEKILNSNGSDKLTQSMSAGGMNDQESPIVSVISGLVEGVKSAVTIEDPTDIIDIALSVLSKLFGGPIAAIFNLIGMVIGLVSFVLAIIEVGASLIKLFAEGIANALPTILFIGGAILGAVLIGSVIGGPGEAFENATTSIRKLGKVGEAVEDLRKIDIEIPDNLMKRIQDIGKKTDGAGRIESIVDDIKIDPSLLNRITGDIDKLSDDDLVSVVRKVKETGKGFDVAEFERLKNIDTSVGVDEVFTLKRELGDDLNQISETDLKDYTKAVLGNPNWKHIPDVRTKISHPDVVKHVMEAEFNGIKVTGGHSRYTVQKRWGTDMTITETSPRNAYGVYETELKLQTPQMSNPVVKSRSTMFPDDWDEARIQDEVEYAVRNNKGLAFPNDPQQINTYEGFSKDGNITIRFYYNPDGSIASYFPVL